MRYFKIMTDNSFIGVVSSNGFLRYQKKHNLYITTTVSRGEVVSYNGQLYHDVWMQPLQGTATYISAYVVEIEEDEYRQLYEAIEQELPIDLTPIQPNAQLPVMEEKKDTITIEYAKQLKIRALQQQCEQAIYSGFDYNDKHYSLTTTDQINLLSAQNQILAGAESAFYHADGEMIQAYSAAEITTLAQHMNTHIADCINTFQVLREHVNELEEVKEILVVEWSDAYGE